MFHVSCYAFHPLFQRFVRLWKHVQVVSEILTCIISMICCQCMDAIPLSPSSSFESKPSIAVFQNQHMHQMANNTKAEQNKVNHGLSSGDQMRAQHVVIDFTPGREDTPEIQAKCQQFWHLENNQAENKTVKTQPIHDSKQHLKNMPNFKERPEFLSKRNNIPAIHKMKKLDKKGVGKSTLEAGQVNRSYT